jgi:hypothetical protein
MKIGHLMSIILGHVRAPYSEEESSFITLKMSSGFQGEIYILFQGNTLREVSCN